MSVGATISAAARRFADRTALIELHLEHGGGWCERRRISYGELHEQVLRLCSALAASGVAPGQRLAVLLDNSIEMVVSEWACLKAGYLWVALNTRSSSRELQAILDDSRPAVLLVATAHKGLLSQVCLPAGCRVLRVGADSNEWQELLERGQAKEPDHEPGPSDPVRLRYTSGTAGRPKGAVLPRRCYDASLAAVSEVIGPRSASDVLVQAAPMTHASGAMLLPHVAAGASALLLDRFEMAAFVEIVGHYGGTAVFLVPTMLVRLIEGLEDGKPLATLATIVYGGASMPLDRLIRGLALLGPVFIQIYGLTESTWPVTALGREEHLCRGDREQWRRRLASCGRPTSVGKLRIVDSDGHNVNAGIVGELLVKGRNTMSSYWGAAAASADDAKGLDQAGWMHTGDLGYRNEHGYITIVDRLHDMIVSGGFNVYPREVEDALSSHPAVLESAVVGRPSTEWGQTVHASVVLKAGASVTPEALVAHCAERIAGYKKPRSVSIVERLPRNAAGKILRRDVRRELISSSNGVDRKISGPTYLSLGSRCENDQ